MRSNQSLRGLFVLLIVVELICLVSLFGGRGGGLALGVMAVGVFCAGLLLSLIGVSRTPPAPLSAGMLTAHLALIGLAVAWRIIGDGESWWQARQRQAESRELDERRALRKRIGQLLGAGKEREALEMFKEHDGVSFGDVTALNTVLCGLGERTLSAPLLAALRRHGAHDGELMSAAAQCSVRAVRALLSANVSPDAITAEGLKPLMLGTHPAALLFMLEHGAATEARSSDGATALMFHRSPQVTRLLLEHGANPRATDKRGLSALHYLGSKDVLADCFEQLLVAGADPNMRQPGYDQHTPLHVLATQAEGMDGEWHDAAAERLFRHGGDLFLRDARGYSALEYLIDNNRDLTPLTRWEGLALADTRGSHLLLFAMKQAEWDAFDALLLAGANPSQPDERGQVPMEVYAKQTSRDPATDERYLAQKRAEPSISFRLCCL